MSRSTIRFVRRGQIVELNDVDPNATLLDYLRLTERSRGTKEGCAEGDCGACTVALGSLTQNGLDYRPVNSCIQLLGMIDGKDVVAVDDLAAADGSLHPVQDALVRHHASQCGFCTPGFVMSLFTLYHADLRPDRGQIVDWLAGNLCRCTGYRPIIDAALELCGDAPADSYAQNRAATIAMLQDVADGDDIFVGDDKRFFASPASIASFADLYQRHPDATVVAGATDVGLWITKQLRDLPKVIHIGRIAGFDEVIDAPETAVIGAGAAYADAEAVLGAIDADLAEVLRRLGSKQVRAAGTVGGNIANGSPIGDMPPMLIALGTTLELQQGESSRQMPLEDFFLAYGKQDRKAGEFVRRLSVPKLRSDQHFRSYKISKRFDQDISAVLGAFRFSVTDGRITEARIAYGGMAATPKRAAAAETLALGLELTDEGQWAAAADALAEDFQPLTDMRASAQYRLQTAQNLLLKALQEIAGTGSEETRVMGIRRTAT